MNPDIIYEQPLNERTRTFLRLDFLFNLARYHLQGTNVWDIRSALNCLLDISDLIARTDIKTELIKELERHSSTLHALQQNPGVDLKTLDHILDDIQQYLGLLRDKDCQPGNALRQDELISSIKQRNAILGGSCNFDLPAYHQWLNRSLDCQTESLERWQEDMEIIRKSIYLILDLVRNSSNPSSESAVGGFFQRPLDQGTNCQLIRIVLPADANQYPEVSAGKHRFTIRFMEQPDTRNRPVQTDQDVNFELHCCIL